MLVLLGSVASQIDATPVRMPPWPSLEAGIYGMALPLREHFDPDIRTSALNRNIAVLVHEQIPHSSFMCMWVFTKDPPPLRPEPLRIPKSDDHELRVSKLSQKPNWFHRAPS